MEPWVDFSVGFIFEVGCEFFRTSLFLNNYRPLRSCSMTWREPTCSPPSSRHGASHRLVQASKPGSWQLTGLRTLLSSLLTYGNGGRRDEGTLGWGNSIWVRISHERFLNYSRNLLRLAVIRGEGDWWAWPKWVKRARYTVVNDNSLLVVSTL